MDDYRVDIELRLSVPAPTKQDAIDVLTYWFGGGEQLGDIQCLHMTVKHIDE